MALGPVANVKNIRVPLWRKLAPFWREIQWALLEKGIHDLADSNWWVEEAELLLCGDLDPKLCEELLKYGADADPEVDNLDRLDVFIKDLPAGQGYQSVVFYAQDVLQEGWRLFDYGPIQNLQKYGAASPPQVPLENFNVPTALVVGTYDKLADPTDAAWLNEQIKDSVVFYEEYPLGHVSFVLAKDMSWFTNDVVNLMGKYATNVFDSEPE